MIQRSLFRAVYLHYIYIYTWFRPKSWPIILHQSTDPDAPTSSKDANHLAWNFGIKEQANTGLVTRFAIRLEASLISNQMFFPRKVKMTNNQALNSRCQTKTSQRIQTCSCSTLLGWHQYQLRIVLFFNRWRVKHAEPLTEVGGTSQALADPGMEYLDVLFSLSRLAEEEVPVRCCCKKTHLGCEIGVAFILYYIYCYLLYYILYNIIFYYILYFMLFYYILYFIILYYIVYYIILYFILYDIVL